MTDPPWLALLAALPPDARPARRPVVPDSMAELPEAAAVAGWYTLIVDLSLPSRGHRVTMATLVGNTLLSGSDMVFRMMPDANIMESLGGRFEPDGTFHGTHWHCVLPPGTDAPAESGSYTPREPSSRESGALRALLDDLCRRALIS